MPKEDEFFGAEDCAIPRNPASDDFALEQVKEEDEQRALFGYATKYCKSPKLKFYKRPSKDGCCVADGSQYMAVLITGEDFGCSNFKPKSVTEL